MSNAHMEYEDYLIREMNTGPVYWCNKCDRHTEDCVCDGKWCRLFDTAYADRQEMIHNLSGSKDEPVGKIAPEKVELESRTSGVVAPPAQTLPDTWEAIEAQLDYWAQMDAAYWQQRKEKAYAAWMERTYGV